MTSRLPFSSTRPRHRALPVAGTKPASQGAVIASAAVASGILAVTLGAAAFGPGSVNQADAATLDASSAVSPVAAKRPVAATKPPAQSVKLPVAVAASASGPVTGGTVMTVTGAELTRVSAVQVGGVPATVVEATHDTLSYEVPVASGSSTGVVPVELIDVTGSAVPVATEVPAPAAPASAGPELIAPLRGAEGPDAGAQLRALVLKPGAEITPADTADAAAAEPAVPSEPAMLSFEYLPDPRVTAQTDYVLRHWNDYNQEYRAIRGNDCVNFTSQGLLARGWQMDAEWNYNGAGSAAWVSSTAFRDYMAAHPERGTELDDSQRASVKVGDVAQFDWDNSGDRDHTATVTRVEQTANGVAVYVGGHSKDSDYWDVDVAIAGGGSVHYWSLN